MQQRYWNQMTQYKYSLLYLSAHFLQCVGWNRRIKIGVAVVSTGAIAAWTTWTNLSYFWGLVIVIGQVISAINEILPYQKRIKELSKMKARLNALYIEIERKWFDVSEGHLSQEEINRLCYEQEQEWDSICQEYFQEDALPVSKHCKNYAEEEKTDILKINSIWGIKYEF